MPTRNHSTIAIIRLEQRNKYDYNAMDSMIPDYAKELNPAGERSAFFQKGKLLPRNRQAFIVNSDSYKNYYYSGRNSNSVPGATLESTREMQSTSGFYLVKSIRGSSDANMYGNTP